MSRRFLLLWTIAVGVAGCEWVAGINDKTLADGGVAIDGGADASSDARVPSDSPLDTNAPLDVVDAQTAADASISEPSAPCSQQGAVIYCNDFDTSNAPGDNWDYNLANGGSTVALDTTHFASPPKSVQFNAPVAANSQAQLGHNATGTASSWFHFAFDLRIDMTSLNGTAQVGIAQANIANGRSYNFIVGPGVAASVEVYDGNNPTPTAKIDVAAPAVNTWTRIVIAEDAVKGLAIYEGDKLVGSDPQFTGGMAAPQIIVGNVFTNPPGATAMKFEIDNVVLRGQ